MKLRNTFYLLIMALVTLSSCVKEPMVLEFDDSYIPKSPQKGDKDPLPPVDLLNVYAYFMNNEVSQTVNRIKNNDGTLSISEIADREMVLRTSIPVEVSTKIELVKMTAENGGEVYPKTIKGLTIELPEEAYQLSTNAVALAIGEKTATVKIQFHKEAFLAFDKTKTYALPIVMRITEGTAEIVNNYILYISLQDVELLPQGNNVVAGKNVPSGTVFSGGKLTLTSNYAQGHLSKLNDGDSGDYSKNWWVQSGGSSWLGIGLESAAKIKAVILRTHRHDYKTIQSVKVWASQDGGTTSVEQGTVSFGDNTKTAVVSFKTPININYVKLSDFMGYYPVIDLHEVELRGE